MSLDIVILAAGQGTRMHSKQPKVLQLLAGKPLLSHVVDNAKKLKPSKLFVVHGHEGERVQEALANETLHWVHQQEQLGTAHAVEVALEHIEDNKKVLVLSGDVPLLTTETLAGLYQASLDSTLSLLTAVVPEPFGLGRIMRDGEGQITAVIEERDATDEQRAIHEIYSGVLIADSSFLKASLPKLNNQNAQGEFYLTSVVALAVNQGITVASHITENTLEILGVNDKVQLQQLERQLQLHHAEQLMKQGVSMQDPARFDLRGELNCGRDVFIDANVIFEGKVTLDENVHIESNCIIKDSHIKKDARVLSHTRIEGAEIGERATVGPFARIRPGTVLEENAKVGNFVETKKTHLSKGAKASHLSYLGDCWVGEHVNIGAGTITCNYDGVNKHQTTIEKGAFIGSGTQLVAPITVGENATLGAGTTLRKDAPKNALTLSAKPQKTVLGWKKPE